MFTSGRSARAAVGLMLGLTFCGCRQVSLHSPWQRVPQADASPTPVVEPALDGPAPTTKQLIPPTPPAEAQSSAANSEAFPTGFDANATRDESQAAPDGYDSITPAESNDLIPPEPLPLGRPEPEGPVAALDYEAAEIDFLQFLIDLNQTSAQLPLPPAPIERSAVPVVVATPVQIVSRQGQFEAWPPEGLPNTVVICPAPLAPARLAIPR